MTTKWIDVTMPISPEMMVYKNKAEKRPVIISRATHAENGYCESGIQMDLHTGTHVDMPLHMVDGGADSTAFDVTKINGKALVIDFSGEEATAITEAFLKPHLDKICPGDIVIFKTKNALSDAFNFEFDYLDASGAACLAALDIKAVGIDALGIERGSKSHETHKTLMGADIYIIEGLALREVVPGRYDFHCLPMKIEGVDGLPARAFLSELG